MCKMDDNTRIVLIWFMISITIIFIGYQLTNTVKGYNEKITEIHRYTLKFPDGKLINHNHVISQEEGDS